MALYNEILLGSWHTKNRKYQIHKLSEVKVYVVEVLSGLLKGLIQSHCLAVPPPPPPKKKNYHEYFKSKRANILSLGRGMIASLLQQHPPPHLPYPPLVYWQCIIISGQPII